MLSMPIDNLKLRAEKIRQLIENLPGIASCETIQDHSMLGGGSLPTQKIPTYCVAIKTSNASIERLAERLRSVSIPVIGRISKDQLLLDLRTIAPAEDMQVVNGFESLAAS
jgi:L-seryl-tRNA(Ser) seleniumtransferase